MRISVSLEECLIGDLGAKCLTKYLGNDRDHDSIVVIILNDNPIHEEGTSYIAGMLYFIEHLLMSFNPIGDTGAVRDSVTVKTLILQSCGITSRGAKSLSRALAQNSSLTKLDIARNNLGDVGISHIAEALKQSTQLKELWIGGCGITDKGAASLASALKVNKSLKMLHMGGGKGALTEDGLSRITKSLTIKTEFVKLAISDEFNSVTTLRLEQKINKARKKNGLPLIEINGE